jgi:predicted PurR-regulated permease PerM
MIELLPTLLLLCLLISVVFLIRLFLQMPDSLDSKTDYLTTELKDISITLNDIADLFNDALGAINNSPIAQTPSSPMESILSGLISSIMTPKSHGSTQEPQIGALYEIDPTPLQTENESN